MAPSLGLLIPVLVIAAGMWWWRMSRRTAGPVGGTAGARSATGGPTVSQAATSTATLEPVLDRAVAGGLVSRDTADAILRQERDIVGAAGAAPRPAKIPAAAEAVGYDGAAVLILGVISLIGTAWPDLGVGPRAAILASAVAVLVGAGVPLHDDVPIECRLRTVVWGLSVGAMAGLAAEVVVDGFEWSAEPAAIGIGSAVAIHAGSLWGLRERPTVQAGTLVGLLVAVGGVLAWLAGPAAIGAGISVVGLGWLVLAWRHLVPPDWSAVPLGCAAVLVGPGVAAGEWASAGPVVGVALAAVVVAVGAAASVLVVTVAGVVGVVVYLPWTLTEIFGESNGPGVTQVVTGVVLLGAMLVLLRFRRTSPEAS